MTVNLTIPIECGENTCSVDRDKGCKYYRWDIRGIATCRLFGEDLRDKDGDVMGLILRCKQCKEAESVYKGATAGGGWDT
jgi:hypothetical protein